MYVQLEFVDEQDGVVFVDGQDGGEVMLVGGQAGGLELRQAS